MPGAIEAWAAVLRSHGRFGLDRALAPAIRHAEHGFPVTPRVAYDWTFSAEALRADPGAARHYLIDGRAPATGDIMRFPALAATLKAIAARGPKAFYEEAAADIVATLAPRGSWLTREDFANHRGEEATPIASNYRGLDVVELPPNGQGLVALVLLNILERFDLASLDPHGPERLHIALEAARMAFAVRDTHVADPGLDAGVGAVADRQGICRDARQQDRPQQAHEAAAGADARQRYRLSHGGRPRPHGGVVHQFALSASSDRRSRPRSPASCCTAAAHALRSTPPIPNAIGPSKRPMNTIIPALGMRDGRCELAFGVMGAHYQPMGHAHVVTNLVDYRMDLQAAIDSPRVFFEGEDTIVERGISAAAIDGLEQRGHHVTVRQRPWGGGQAIAIDWQRGVLIGASDARKDGCALGY